MKFHGKKGPCKILRSLASCMPNTLHPASHSELVKLSIANKKFKDVLDYYKFCPNGSDEACLSLAAGLVLTGRNYPKG